MRRAQSISSRAGHLDLKVIISQSWLNTGVFPDPYYRETAFLL
jgi:hypothetical protein